MIKLGQYQHYKGGLYEVIAVAKHSEGLEELVIYRSLANGQYWARPINMFTDNLTIDNQRITRFKYLQ